MQSSSSALRYSFSECSRADGVKKHLPAFVFLLASFAAIVAVSWLPVLADYPDGVKADYKFYVCTTFRSESGTNPYSEPECQELPLDSVTLDSAAFEWSMICGPGTCQQWYRNYIVPPEGVIDFTVSCALSGFVDDQGLGSGSFGHQRNDAVSIHGDNDGTTMGLGFTGLAFITYSHVAFSTYGHDAGDNSHDPFYDYLDGGPDSAGYQGWYIETTATTSGSDVTVSAAGNCYVDSWTGPYIPPTPTPTPFFTATPWWFTLPTPVPWLTPAPWVMTPEPGDFFTEPGVETCYVIFPARSFGPITVFGYDIGFAWDAYEFCVTEVDLTLSFLGFEFGSIFVTLLLVSGFAVLFARIR
jgi:hypothetical protein